MKEKEIRGQGTGDRGQSNLPVVKAEEGGGTALDMSSAESERLSEGAAEITVNSLVLNPQIFSYMEKLAAIMASGRCTIPAHLAGNKGDCFAVIMQAAQWRMSPWPVAQKTYIVNGVLGYEAQLVSAVAVSSGAIHGKFFYEWFGPWEKVVGKFVTKVGKSGNAYQAPGWKPEDEDGCGIRVSAVLRGEVEPRSLELLLSQATVRNSTLWASDPKQQLAYLAVKRWCRLYAPETILGVYTPDEIELDSIGGYRDIKPVGESQTEKLKDILKKGTEDGKGKREDEAKDGREKVDKSKAVAGEVVEEENTKKGDLPGKGNELKPDGLPEGHRKALFAELHRQGISEDNFRSGLRIFFGIESTRAIAPGKQYDEIMEWLKDGCPAR